MKKVLISLDDIENMCDGLKLELLSRNIDTHLLLKLIATMDSISKVYKKWFDAQPDVGLMDVNQLIGHKERALSKMETTGDEE